MTLIRGAQPSAHVKYGKLPVIQTSGVWRSYVPLDVVVLSFAH